MSLPLTIISLLAAVAVGVFIGIGMEVSTSTAERLLAPVGVVLRAILPVGFWARAMRHISSLRVLDADGSQVHWVTDGLAWVAVFDRPNQHFRFSPLLLAPSWLIRRLVSVFGHEMRFAQPHKPGTGYVVKGLQLSSGFIIARRRSEDLAYLKENGRYPSTPLNDCRH